MVILNQGSRSHLRLPSSLTPSIITPLPKLFMFFTNYCPESMQEEKARLGGMAAAVTTAVMEEDAKVRYFLSSMSSEIDAIL